MSKKTISIISMFISFVLVFSIAQNARAEKKDLDQALIILSTDTIGEMQAAKKAIKKIRGKIRNVFPPSAFIGTLSQEQASELNAMDFIQLISFVEVNATMVSHTESSVYDAVRTWNKLLTQPDEPELKDLRLLEDDVTFPSDLPETKEEKERQDKEYLERWKKKKKELERREEEKKLKRLEREGKAPQADDSSSQNVPDTHNGDQGNLSGETLYAPGSGVGFGTSTGAGYTDTSLYMAGKIAVGVFFDDGTLGPWPNADDQNPEDEINTAFSTITTGLDRFITDDPNADISFTHVKEVDGSGSPNPVPGTAGSPYANARDYINDLRNTLQTDWAYMIVVLHGSGRANANYWGPTTYLYSAAGVLGDVARHETMHIFGAMDQYCPDACRSPIDLWGYLDVVNANARTNDGNGYFGGAGEGLSDIMIVSVSQIGVYSRGQIGWRDSDGDGLLDPMDTIPDTAISSRTGTYQLTYTGPVTDQPLLNEGNRGDVTLNHITAVEYRINGGAWIQADPVDGMFDYGDEEYIFTTPGLSDGTYTIEIRAINSVGNVEVSYTKDVVTVTSSPVMNVTPFPAFSITPPEGSVGTLFTLDASESSDLEDASSSLEVRWDFENDGTWDTSFSTNKAVVHNYSTSGTKIIKLEVRDSGAVLQSITKDVNVSSANLPPNAVFTATPENQHGPYLDFPVLFDASLSWDGEDDSGSLQFRWDFEDDGVWDTGYLSTSTYNYSYQLPQTPPAHQIVGTIDLVGAVNDAYVSGNYAYIADTSGFSIVDVSDPANPVLTGSYSTSSAMSDVDVSGNYAYTTGGVVGLSILDITDPYNPTLAGSYGISQNPLGVFVTGTHAYVAAREGGLLIIDITDTGNPVFAGSHATTYAMDVQVVGNYAYVADNTSGLLILDITDPSNTVEIGNYSAGNSMEEVVVSGNYAYVADQSAGLTVIDVSDPANPALSGTLDTPGSARGVYVSGNTAYVADTAAGLLTIDVTDPASPSLSVTTETSGLAVGVFVSGMSVYVADYSAGLQIIDLTAPLTEPVVMDASDKWRARLEVMDSNGNTAYATRDGWAVTYNGLPYIQDVTISDSAIYVPVGSYDSTGNAVDVFISGNYAYLVNYTSNLEILDITDPASPVFTGSYPDTALVVYVSGNYAYLATGYSGLKILDITDPSVPALTGSYDTPDSAQSVFVSGNLAYVADGVSGLSIIDVTNPAAPFVVANYDTPGYAYDIYVSGVYAYVADENAGLQIIDVSDPASPTLAGNYDTPDVARRVHTSGNHAYVADVGSGLLIIDITDPSNPSLAGSYSVPYAYNIFVDGNHAHLAGNAALFLLDVTDPASPVQLSMDNTVNPEAIFATGDNVFAAVGGSGLKVYELSSQQVLSVTATDPDINTTWDGLLEFRWDEDNDGVWDTDYSADSSPLLALPDTGAFTVTCEARDRFHGTDMMSVYFCDPTGAADDICDGIDDDCDGIPDDGYVPTPTASTCGIGVCSATGQLECIEGFISDLCVPGPKVESFDVSCDGLDGDCDGSIDEDYIITATSCGVGECSAAGQLECQGGVEADTCLPGAPQTEVCNGLDDNCDGTVDDGFDTDGDGYATCANDCNDSDPAVNPGTTEVCNGIDDNCDTAVDEGCVLPNEIWAAPFDSGSIDYGYAIAADSSGNTYMTGNQGTTVKFDPSGNVIWSRNFSISGRGIAVDNSGNVYITGMLSAGCLIMKYDADGNEAWAGATEHADGRYCESIAVDSNGDIYVGGRISNGSNDDFLTIKYDPSGNELWARTYDNSGVNYSWDSTDWVYDIAVDQTGNVYTVGTGNYIGANYSRAVIVKYDTSGNIGWTGLYTVAENHPVDINYGFVADLDSSGNIYLAGWTRSIVDSIDKLFIKRVDPVDGSVIWTNSYDEIIPGERDQINGMVVTETEGVEGIFVTGWYLTGTSNYNTYLRKFDLNGNLIGNLTYDSGNADQAYDVAADGNGNVYVGGTINTGSSWDYLLIRYADSINCPDSDGDGYTTCHNDCNDSDPSINPGAADALCNGTDDDCDGSTDEDWTSIPTTCGTGVCGSTGNTTCTGGVEGNTCTPGSPTENPEQTCTDDNDNDCDGLIDFLDTADCGPPDCSGYTRKGDCNQDANCKWNKNQGICEYHCTVTETPEITCNDGFDNDCDGSFDNVDSDCISCIPTGNPDDNCDGIDDDCNGTADDAYVPTQTNCGIGECAATGQLECQGGTEVDTCSPGSPQTEGPEGDQTCTDSLDNDCDGDTDILDADCVCIPTGNPDDNCDGIDDDCNGTADDAYMPTGTSCGIGECAATGQLECQGGSVVDTCSPGAPQTEGPPGDPTCSDGLDNDCDTHVDDPDPDCVVPPSCSDYTNKPECTAAGCRWKKGSCT